MAIIPTNQPTLISNNQPLYQTSNQPSHYPKIPTLILSNPFRLVPLLGDPNLLVQLSQYPILSSVWHPHQGVTPLNWTLTFLVSTSVYCSLGTLSKSGQTAGLLRHCGLSATRKYQDIFSYHEISGHFQCVRNNRGKVKIDGRRTTAHSMGIDKYELLIP